MRCINCGFDNPAGASICTKCGQPLGSGHAVSEPAAFNAKSDAPQRPTVIGVSAGAETAPRETVIEVGGRPQNDAPRETLTQNQMMGGSSHQCPNCKYPILDSTSGICPNCKMPLTTNVQSNNATPTPAQENKPTYAQVVCSKCKESVPAHFHFCPNCGNKIHQATEWHGIRGIVTEEPIKKLPFSLTIIPDADEKLSIKECEFTCMENQAVVLNRENTDSENRSITSKQQAEISYENGHWFIKNLSDNESTFMVANRKMELQDGDIILLGYRYFKFNKK